MIHSTSFDFCLMFIFFCFNTGRHTEPGPPPLFRSHLTRFPKPSAFFQELPSFPRLPPPTPPIPPPAFCPRQYSLGVQACAACVCGPCVCVYLVCSERECVCVCVCVGVKASLCMLAGIGSNPGVPFTHLWNQQSGFQAPFSIHQTQPLPHSAYPHSKSCTAPYSPTLTLQGKHGFHNAKKEQGCKLPPPPPCSIYLC
ncbi:hypothetical protein PFLUV_G00239830 [Perca fluviatilis]|uniref:Uncharacterized protein n=1 Tax=Perca fluviatilis TaxID=8168 RepID=A0A6A5E5N9_PERFL|nr:hypothetical protein PFLUV_G00239830 [Perca fluviatilis]